MNTATLRRQGFYGVRETGVPRPPSVASDAIASVYDAADPGRAINVEHPGNVGELDMKQNAMYVEIEVAVENLNSPHTLVITVMPDPDPDDPYDDPDPIDIVEIEVNYLNNIFNQAYPNYDNATPPNPIYNSANNFYRALDAYNPGNDLIYWKENVYNLAGDTVERVRFIWVIDYFGETLGPAPSFQGVQKDVFYPALRAEPGNIRIEVSREGDNIPATSSDLIHSHFRRRITAGSFEITSGRHLNNIRYACPTNNYRQNADIDLDRVQLPNNRYNNNRISNFVPISFEGSCPCAIPNCSCGYMGEYRVSIPPEIIRVICDDYFEGCCDSCIPQFEIVGLTINDPSGTPAGLFRKLENSASINGMIIRNANITAYGGGVIAGVNYGSITESMVVDSVMVVNGGDVGAITGNNAIDISITEPGIIPYGRITDSVVSGTSITGAATNAGGIAGQNGGSIIQSAVEYSTVLCGGLNIGGIVGFNHNIVENVYFLFTNTPPYGTLTVPVSDVGGGIAGRNNGTVIHALYIAPAPGSATLIYPIVREGTTSEDSFFLRGRQYTFSENIPGGDNYNFLVAAENIDAATYGVTTEEMIRSWIESTIDMSPHDPLNIRLLDERFDNHWRHVDSDYPYPVLMNIRPPGRGFPTASGGKTIERRFDDVPVIRVPFDLNFINGDFNLPMRRPNTDDDITINHFNDTTVTTSSNCNCLATATVSHNAGCNGNVVWKIPTSNTTPAIPLASGGNNARQVVGNSTFAGAGGRANYWSYYDHMWVQGWNVRSVVESGMTQTRQLGGSSVTLSRLMEFQRPTSNRTTAGAWAGGGTALIDYRGRMNMVYAELNAEQVSTFYQICDTINPTRPNDILQFYYAYRHLTRAEDGEFRDAPLTGANSIVTDAMSFYLTPPTGEAHGHAGFNNALLNLIRPARSPRSLPASGTTSTNIGTYPINSFYWNPVASNTVSYGSYYVGDPEHCPGRNASCPTCEVSFNVSLRRYWDSANEHWSVSHLSPFTGASWSSPIFIYDVWIWEGTVGAQNNNTLRTGYGITFWSNTAITALQTANHRGYANIGALATATGLTQAQIEARTFGYWDVEFGWKKYYGIFTVPQNQPRTEFAFQSNAGRATSGNYLAGIDFVNAPAYLTATQTINTPSGTSFVGPNDNLTVVTQITNAGRVTAASIVFENQLSPFHQVVDFTAGSVSGAPAGSTITEPNEANNYTLTVTFPPGYELAQGQTVTVSFGVRVRAHILNEPVTETTWGYFFRNQARVRYSDKYNRFESTTPDKEQFSPTVRVDISDIVLNKTVEVLNGNTVNPTAPLIAEPNSRFRVTLTINNNNQIHGSDAKGFITDIIPAGFRAENVRILNGTEAPFVRSGQRITIQEVEAPLTPSGGVSYTYDLVFTGVSYGVISSSEASFNYVNNRGPASANFPTVHIAMRIQASNFTWNGTPHNDRNRLNVIDNGEMSLSRHTRWINQLMPDITLYNSDGSAVTYNGIDIRLTGTPTNTVVFAGNPNNMEIVSAICFTHHFFYELELLTPAVGDIPAFNISALNPANNDRFRVDIDYHAGTCATCLASPGP
jgi:hypothetical protein